MLRTASSAWLHANRNGVKESQECGVIWKGGIPDIEEDFEETLMLDARQRISNAQACSKLILFWFSFSERKQESV